MTAFGQLATSDLPESATLRQRMATAAGPVPSNYRDIVAGDGALGPITTTTYQRGSDQRVTVQRGPIHTERGVNAGEIWHQNANGITVVEAPDPVETVLNVFTTTVTRVVKPVDAYEIATLTARGLGTREFVDPQTYHTLFYETISLFGTTTTSFGPYARFGAQTLPTQWTVTDPVAKSTMTYRRTSNDADAATNADIALPPSRNIVHFPNGSEPVMLPVRFENDRMYVRVDIGSRGVDLLLDSGASAIVLNETIARQLSLPFINPQSNTANVARYTQYSTIVPSMRVGPLAMSSVVVSIAPVRNEVHAGLQSEGILGFDFLAGIGATIDYEHHTVTVVPPERYEPPTDPHAIALDVRLGNQIPLTSVRLDGAVSERFLLDTGGTGTFFLFANFSRHNPSVFKTKGPARMFVGVGGTFAASSYLFDELTLGSAHFHKFVGWQAGLFGSFAAQDGYIGTEFLRLFTVGIDYTHSRVYLTPNAAARAASATKAE